MSDALNRIFGSGVGGLTVARAVLDQSPSEPILACDSASAAVLRDARERYDVAVIGVIRPAARRAVRAGHNGRVIATQTRILGCAHYPLLTGAISYVVGDGVTLVSSADDTAKDVYRVLRDARLARGEERPPPERRFRSTGDSAPFAESGNWFLGPEIGVGQSASALAAL